MAVRKLVVFRHENKLGDCAAHKLFEMVAARAISTPVRSFSQYEIAVPDQSAMPQGSR